MALKRINFDLLTPTLNEQRRSVRPSFVPATMPDSLNPDDPLVLRDGEWLTWTADGKQMIRACIGVTIGGDDGLSAAGFYQRPSWPLYAERGRSDIQAVAGGGKLPILYTGFFEADTQLYHIDDLANLTVGKRLVVVAGNPDLAGLTHFSVLSSDNGAAGQGMTVGFVTRAPGDNGGKGLRVYCQAGGFGFGTQA